MQAIELINCMIPPLTPVDKLKKAREWLEELRLTALPVVANQQFLGFLTEEVIYTVDDLDVTVEQVALEGEGSIAHDFQHYYEVLKIATSENTKSVAILDAHEKYLGVITIEDLIEAFGKMSSIVEEGAILIVSTNTRDYYLSEICRLIEAADAKVMSCFVAKGEKDSSQLELTIKINKEETSQVISLLEQNGYNVVESYTQASASVHEQERLDQLMNFLKI